MLFKECVCAQGLEKQLARTEAVVRAYESRVAVANSRAAALKEGIAVLWQRTGCASLGEETGHTPCCHLLI